MGFYYDKNSDQERMLNKFEKVRKRNKQEMNEDHPDFDPTMLPLAEQFKYWERKNEIAREAKENQQTTNTRLHHYSHKKA